MDQQPSCQCREHLIAVYDLENFIHISSKLSLPDLFGFLNDLQVMTIDALMPHHPLIIKNIGDSNFMVFPLDGADAIVRGLLGLKNKIESFINGKGFSGRVSLSAHCGEIAVGFLGKEPFQTVDAFGDAVSTVFIMNGKPFKGRFNISPQLFRKLESATRKRFHKYTPPVTYLAE